MPRRKRSYKKARAAAEARLSGELPKKAFQRTEAYYAEVHEKTTEWSGEVSRSELEVHKAPEFGADWLFPGALVSFVRERKSAIMVLEVEGQSCLILKDGKPQWCWASQLRPFYGD